jgi:hypothetical protein
MVACQRYLSAGYFAHARYKVLSFASDRSPGGSQSRSGFSNDENTFYTQAGNGTPFLGCPNYRPLSLIRLNYRGSSIIG